MRSTTRSIVAISTRDRWREMATGSSTREATTFDMICVQKATFSRMPPPSAFRQVVA